MPIRGLAKSPCKITLSVDIGTDIRYFLLMILFLDETGTQNFTKPGKKPHHYDVFALT